MDSFEHYLRGEKLYGDDFQPEEIAAWYSDEAEAYANLGARDSSAYSYQYHAVNWMHGFRHLSSSRFSHALGFGSAYGHELGPVLNSIDRVTIVDPSDAFEQDEINGKPCTYLKPTISGDLPVADAIFDLITCFGVLHHIPNVTHVCGEFARTLAPGGQVLIREPIVSMGDWRMPRYGLTARERGIPLNILEDILTKCGLVLEHRALCMFPLVPRLFGVLGLESYNNQSAVWLDSILSNLFRWNLRYHAENSLQKLRPTSAFLIASKPARAS